MLSVCVCAYTRGTTPSQTKTTFPFKFSQGMIGIIDEGILKKGSYPTLISSRKVYIQAHTHISMTDMDIIIKMMKETKKNSDDGVLVLKWLEIKGIGKIFLATEEQLKKKIRLT